MQRPDGTLAGVQELGAERVAVRPGRCANHPAVAQVAKCTRCRRPLCVACAVPIRGTVFGPECLPTVLEDASIPTDPPVIVLPRGDLIAAAGFGAVVLLSVLPWSRFGDAAGAFGAWNPHWSLLAVGAATLGLILALVFWRRPRDPRLEIAVYLGLAAVVAVAAYLHHRHPPSLSSPSGVPFVATAAALVAAVAAAMKATALLRARRRRS